MDWGGGAVFGALMLVLALVLGGVYAVARLRHGKAPDHAQRHGHVSSHPAGDEDPVPRESGGGMPMALPDDGQAPSVEDLQDKAQRRAPHEHPGQAQDQAPHQARRNAS